MSKKCVSWTEEEQQIFFKCLEVYGNDFYSYTYHLNRTHSQIKSHYHNWLKQHKFTTNDVQLNNCFSKYAVEDQLS
ncbi:Myb domain [Hexamita inflata]|uniref:Myb domain n=1 Tax=Hexamita inflata TaxID=28002 RepID=A0ABP1HJE6_9EUKA